MWQRNHLSGLQKTYLKIKFDTVQQLMRVKSDLMHIVERNRAKADTSEAYESIFSGIRYLVIATVAILHKISTSPVDIANKSH